MKDDLRIVLFLSVFVIFGCNSNKVNDESDQVIITKDDSKMYGKWFCSSQGTSSAARLLDIDLEFIDDVVIVKTFRGAPTNTKYKKTKDKILFDSGDVLTVINQDTLLFPIPIPQFGFTVDCICVKKEDL